MMRINWKLILIAGICLFGFASCQLFYPPYFYEKIVHSNSDASNWPKIYVSSTLGNDINSGTNASEPLLNIQTALDRSTEYGFAGVRILVEGGNSAMEYSPTNGLNANEAGIVISRSHVLLEGGYTKDFSQNPLRSVLNGLNPSNGISYRVLQISNATDVSVRFFDISSSSASYGGASIDIVDSKNCQIGYVSVSGSLTPTEQQGTLAAVMVSNSSEVLIGHVDIYSIYHYAPVVLSGDQISVDNCSLVSCTVYAFPLIQILSNSTMVSLNSNYFDSTSQVMDILTVGGGCSDIRFTFNDIQSQTTGSVLLSESGLSGISIQNNLINIDRINTMLNFYLNGSYCTVGSILDVNQAVPLYGAQGSGGNRITSSNGFVCVSSGASMPSPSPSASSVPEPGVGSQNSPFQRVQSAVDVIPYFDAGEEIRLQNGTYYAGGTLNSGPNGVNIGQGNFVMTGGWNADYMSQSGLPTVFDGTGLQGHGIYASGCGSLTLSNIQVVNVSHANSLNGGGALFDHVTNLTIQDCMFSNNQVWNDIACGGGIALISCEYGRISNTSFSGNLALNYGGSLYINSCPSLYIYNAQFLSNICTNSSRTTEGGGAVYAQNGSYFLGIYDSTFKNNEADWGGAILSTGTYLTISNCQFVTNYGENMGFSEVLINTTDMNANNLVIENNTFIGANLTSSRAISEGGSISGHYLRNNTFLNNSYYCIYYNYENSGFISSLSDLTTANTGAADCSNNLTN